MDLGSVKSLVQHVLEESLPYLPAPHHDSCAAVTQSWGKYDAGTQQMPRWKGTVPAALLSTSSCFITHPTRNKSFLPAGLAVPSRMMPCCHLHRLQFFRSFSRWSVQPPSCFAKNPGGFFYSELGKRSCSPDSRPRRMSRRKLAMMHN